MFWRICGDVNPLDGGKRYHQLSFLKRVWIFKGLCDTVAHSHKTVQEAMAEEEGPESRQVTLGTDSDGFTYLHFPAVSGSDIRVYRQKSWDVEQDPVWGPIVAERRIEEEERAREEERRAELLRRQRRAAAAAKRTPSRKPPAKKKPAARYSSLFTFPDQVSPMSLLQATGSVDSHSATEAIRAGRAAPEAWHPCFSAHPTASNGPCDL